MNIIKLANRALTIICSSTILFSCGVTETKYEDYGGNKSTRNCTAAAESFTANIAPTVPSSCGAGCHFDGGSGASKLLFVEDDTENRQVFKNARGGDAAAIFSYIDGASHPGSAGDLTQDKIATWLAVESDCAAD